jgi:hypothetical protein
VEWRVMLKDVPRVEGGEGAWQPLLAWLARGLLWARVARRMRVVWTYMVVRGGLVFPVRGSEMVKR